MVCPISIVGPDGTRILYGGEPPVPDLPPAPPTGLTAVAGDAQVTLTWDPNTEPDLVDYRVRTTVPTDQLSAIVPADQTTHVETGLTNGTAYTFVLRAKDAAGNVSEDSETVTVTPRATSTTTRTIFGFNTADEAPLSSRLVKWDNRAPCVRRYSGNQWSLGNGQFQFTTAVAPEKRISYSTKANASGSFSKAGIAAGNANSQITEWAESIPGGADPWWVDLCYYHEVNDDIREGGMTVAQYRDAYEQIRTAIDAATLQPGVVLKLSSNFMAYRVADTPTYFSDSWVPPVGVAHRMTFDIYGNPGHFTSLLLQPECSFSEGGEYGTSHPNVTTRFRDMFEAIERNGFADHWGILELNTPPRNWDGPTNPDYRCGTNKRLRYQGGKTVSGHDATHTEVERAAWFTAAIEHCLNPPMTGKVPPEILLIWEHPSGVNWNQKFYHNNVWNAIKPYMVGSP